MIEEYKKDAEERMNRAVEVLGQQFNRIRTGRAHPSLLDDIRVSYYGADTPLNQLANINVEDGRTLTVVPWEKNIVPERSEEHTSELQSRGHLVCRLLLEKKKKRYIK